MTKRKSLPALIAGIFFGLMFGISGIGAAAMGHIVDVAGIEQVYRIASFLLRPA